MQLVDHGLQFEGSCLDSRGPLQGHPVDLFEGRELSLLVLVLENRMDSSFESLVPVHLAVVVVEDLVGEDVFVLGGVLERVIVEGVKLDEVLEVGGHSDDAGVLVQDDTTLVVDVGYTPHLHHVCRGVVELQTLAVEQMALGVLEG